MKTTVNILCYKSKKLSNNEHPLVLCICKDRKRKYQSLGISVKQEHWDFNKNRPKPNCPNKELILQIILEKETEYQKQILELKAERKDYTAVSLFKSTEQQIIVKSVLEFYTELITNLKETGKSGNSRIYNDSLRSLKSFTSNKLNFSFDYIDVQWLKNYENWLHGKDCKETTISVLFRTLRSAYNKAVENDYVKSKENPFIKFKVSKFNTSTEKRAISKEDIKKIMGLDVSTERYYIRFSKDMFVFSYLCGGINFTDISNLTRHNVIEDRLTYIVSVSALPYCQYPSYFSIFTPPVRQ